MHADNGYRCQVEGCETLSQSGGRCIKHGGGRRCEVAGCDKSNTSGGKCIDHGDGTSRCKFIGCKKYSRGCGKCWKHGGGVRCQVVGCSRTPCKNAKSGQCFVHLNFTAATVTLMDDAMESQQGCSQGPAPFQYYSPCHPHHYVLGEKQENLLYGLQLVAHVSLSYPRREQASNIYMGEHY